MFGKKIIIIDESSVEKVCPCGAIKETKQGKVIGCYQGYEGDKKNFIDYDDQSVPIPVCEAMIISRKNNSVDLEKLVNCQKR